MRSIEGCEVWVRNEMASSISSLECSSGANSGARDKVSAMWCVFPGTQDMRKVYRYKADAGSGDWLNQIYPFGKHRPRDGDLYILGKWAALEGRSGIFELPRQ